MALPQKYKMRSCLFELGFIEEAFSSPLQTELYIYHL